MRAMRRAHQGQPMLALRRRPVRVRRPPSRGPRRPGSPVESGVRSTRIPRHRPPRNPAPRCARPRGPDLQRRPRGLPAPRRGARPFDPWRGQAPRPPRIPAGAHPPPTAPARLGRRPTPRGWRSTPGHRPRRREASPGASPRPPPPLRRRPRERRAAPTRVARSAESCGACGQGRQRPSWLVGGGPSGPGSCCSWSSASWTACAPDGVTPPARRSAGDGEGGAPTRRSPRVGGRGLLRGERGCLGPWRALIRAATQGGREQDGRIRPPLRP